MNRCVLISLITLSSAIFAHGQFALVSDFEGLTDGALNGQGDWITNNGLFTVADDPTNAGNKVMSVAMGAAGRAAAEISLGSNEILNGQSGTLFFRIRQDGLGPINLSPGLSDMEASSGFDFSDLESYFRSTSNVSGAPFQARDAGDFDTLQDGDGGPVLAFDADTWINVWIFSDNNADTTQFYFDFGSGIVQGFNGAQTDFAFRNGTGDALQTFLVTTGNDTGTGGLAYVDDIYIASGLDLSNPTVVPEPSTWSLVTIGILAFARRPLLRHLK